MTPIDPSQGLAAALQAQLARARQRAPTPRSAGNAAAAGSRRAGVISRTLAQRIAALAPEDPERPRKAVRIYLEAELAREFGASVLNDPEFPALLEAVQARLQEDAQTAAAVAALGRLLLAGKAHPP